jgi:hypothetical protein
MSRLFGYYIIYDELTDDFDNGLEATSVDDLGLFGQFSGALLVDKVDEGGFVLVLELIGLESSLLLVHDCFARSSMSFVTNVLDVVEIIPPRSVLGRVAQQRADQSLLQRFEDAVKALSPRTDFSRSSSTTRRHVISNEREMP